VDIKQPIIHDRHVVKQFFENMKSQNLHKNAFKMPKDLTIVTCRNKGSMEDRIIDHLKGYEEKSILESSLEYLGIDGLVVLRDGRLPWRNTFKFEMLNNYLNSGKCKTKYFMCCDAIDVIFKDDPQRVIDIFESFDCDSLFMSTHSTDGYNCMPDVKEFVDKINGGNGRYLNSGVYIAKTEFIKEVVGESMNYAIPHGVTMDKYREYLNSTPSDYPKGSQDQDIFRFLEKKFYPRLKVDYKNLMAYRG
jgi:hypothetical protein